MDYEEAMDCEDISPVEAWGEIRRHCDSDAEAQVMWTEFLEEHGSREEYTGEEVLGY